jgi:hypothetical protein
MLHQTPSETRGFQQRCQPALKTREASAASAAQLCAGHAQQLGGESPLPNLMEVKG